MPTGVGPKRSAHRRVGNHEADRVGNLLGFDQTSQLCTRNNVFANECFTQGANHGGVSITRMNHAAADAMENGLHHERGGCSLEAGLAGGVSDLPLVPERGDRTDENDSPLEWFGGFPAFEPEFS